MKRLSFLYSETFWRCFLIGIMAAIFITAGILKLADPVAFATDISRYRIFSETWSHYVAAILPVLEVMAGVGLFFRQLRLASSFLILGLMGVFTIAVASALVRGLDISCGCFGKAFEEYAGSGGAFLLRDLFLLVLAILLFWQSFRQKNMMDCKNKTSF